MSCYFVLYRATVCICVRGLYFPWMFAWCIRVLWLYLPRASTFFFAFFSSPFFVGHDDFFCTRCFAKWQLHDWLSFGWVIVVSLGLTAIGHSCRSVGVRRENLGFRGESNRGILWQWNLTGRSGVQEEMYLVEGSTGQCLLYNILHSYFADFTAVHTVSSPIWVQVNCYPLQVSLDL